jgi:plastocyanin
LLAASVMVVSSTTGLLVAAPAPAGAADVNLYQVHLSEERGFNPGTVKVRVGDYIAFILEKEPRSYVHSVTFDDQSVCPTDQGNVPCWPELRFNDPNQKCMLRNYVLPNTRCIEVLTVPPGGLVRYHDELAKAAGGPDFQGVVEVVSPSAPTTTTVPPPSTTTTTAAPTTTSTGPAATTTTTLPPTTATTAPTTIRPMLIGSPDSTTTTVPPAGGANDVGPGNNSGSTSATTGVRDKDKGKGRGDSASTSTTAASETLPAEMSFADSLDLGPVTLPESVERAETGDGVELDAALDLLSGEGESTDDRGRFLLLSGAAAGVFAAVTGFLAWWRRSSRYLPA